MSRHNGHCTVRCGSGQLKTGKHVSCNILTDKNLQMIAVETKFGPTRITFDWSAELLCHEPVLFFSIVTA